MRSLFPAPTETARRVYPSDEAILAMFRTGRDTCDISRRWFIPEAFVWGAIHRAREAERRQT
jgi:hypothetical protein